MKLPLVLGISGPIASGKDLACSLIQKVQPRSLLFRADETAHRLYATGSPLAKQLIRHFGKEIVGRRGEIDRRKLGHLVFQNARALRYLNRATHPRIRKSLRDFLKTAKRKKVPLVIVNAALLHTIPLHSLVHFSWSIVAGEKVRMQRLVHVRKMAVDVARQRIRAQSRTPFSCPLDRVIHNNTSRAAFVREIRKAYNETLRAWENLSSKAP